MAIFFWHLLKIRRNDVALFDMIPNVVALLKSALFGKWMMICRYEMFR